MSGSIEYVDLGGEDPAVIGLAVEGRISGDDMAELIGRIESVRARGLKARLYVDLSGYAGYERPVAKEKLTHMATLWGGIERCAYVVDKAWMTKMIGLVDAVTPMHLRAFAADAKAEAISWVTAADS